MAEQSVHSRYIVQDVVVQMNKNQNMELRMFQLLAGDASALAWELEKRANKYGGLHHAWVTAFLANIIEQTRILEKNTPPGFETKRLPERREFYK